MSFMDFIQGVVMYQFIKAMALFSGFAFFPISANALDFDQTFTLQMALEAHGFDLGEPDGQIGSATRHALAAFAQKHGSQDDPDSVFLFMYEQSLKSREEITSQSVLDVIRRDVADKLRDPTSVMVRNVFVVKNGTQEIVCGEVNGKNAYGGYAGYTQFFGLPVFMGHFPLMAINDGQTNIASKNCDLAFPAVP